MTSNPDPPRVAPTPVPAGVAAKWRFRPSLFFGGLVAPGVLSVATLLLFERDETYALGAFYVLLIGSLLAGILCGGHFVLSQPISSSRARWGWGFLSVILCSAVAVVLGVGGCAVVNPKLF